MIRNFIVSAIVLLSLNLHAQQFFADSLLHVIATAKADSTKIDAGFKILFIYQRANIDSALYYGNKIEIIGKQRKDSVIIAMSDLNMGFAYGRKGNRVAWMHSAFHALNIADNIKNKEIQAAAYNMIVIPESYVDPAKAFEYQQKAIELKGESKIDVLLMLLYNNMASLYLRFNKADSALIFAAKAAACSIQLKDTCADIWVQKMLGDIYLKMHLFDKAMAYYSIVLKIALHTQWERDLVMAYTALGNYYDSLKNTDSAFYYENKAYYSIYSKGYNTKIAPSKWLYNFYKNKHISDSALKYLETTVASTDSVLNDNTILSLRQQEKDILQYEKEKADALEAHRRNVVITAIGLVVLSTIIVFLLLSRSIGVGVRLIKFLGIVELLIVFEFVNLILHHWLEMITHDSPLLMLLSLVVVASILVPIHEYIQEKVIPKLLDTHETRRAAWAEKVLKKKERNISKSEGQ